MCTNDKQDKEAVPQPASEGAVSRRYCNSSGLDYFESKDARCAECGEVFQSERCVWGGKLVGDFPASCKECAEARARREGQEAQKAFWDAYRKSKIPWCLPELTPFPLPPESKDVPKAFPKRLLNTRELEEVSHQRRILALLYEGAIGGDDVAVKLLMTGAWEYVQALNCLARERPELLRPYARREIVWPALIGKGEKRTPGSSNDQLIKLLELGEESEHRGGWHPDAPSTQTAIAMHGWLERNMDLLGLPGLTDKTREIWFERGWKALMEATNNRPDQHAFLFQIGKSAVKKLHDGKADRRGMSVQTEGMKRDDVIAKIRGLIRKAFYNYTKFAPPH